MEQVMVGTDGNLWLSLLVEQQSMALLLVTFGGMLLFMVIERPRPGQEDASLPVAHWLTNWFLAALNYFVGLWLVLQLGSMSWAQSLQPEVGLFDFMHPLPAVVLLLFLIEGATYALHRLYHSVPLLWRVHAVHHMDRELDVTTSHRHHTLEVVLNMLLLLPLFLLLGAPAVVLVLLSLFRVFVVLFNHSSVSIPPGIDRVLSWFIATPKFHHVHHLSEEKYTNSNYGTVLPWFDYFFGTARRLSDEEQAAHTIGLEYLDRPEDARIDRVLLLPLIWKRSTAGDTRAPLQPAVAPGSGGDH